MSYGILDNTNDAEINQYHENQDGAFICATCSEETDPADLYHINNDNYCGECAIEKAKDYLADQDSYLDDILDSEFEEDAIFLVENTEEINEKVCTHEASENSILFPNSGSSFCKICGYICPF